MKIAVIGSGYVGLTIGTCFSELGNDIICVDVDNTKIDNLKRGVVPFYEPGLEDMLKRNLSEKRISFTTDIKEAIQNSEMIFIAVGTPPGKDHRADLSFVKKAAKDIGKYMDNYKIIVNKSTVPVGTADMVKKIVKESQTKNIKFDVASNPEFLREGVAINDFMNPDRIIIGVDSDKAKSIMSSLYDGVARATRPILFTDVKSAEIIKYASNAMLATRISFMNEVARLCEKVGGDVKEVAKGMGLDSRIGPRFLQAGVGYGGSCFPKDVKALAQTMSRHEVDSKLLHAVEEVNENQKRSLLPKLKKLLGSLEGKNIAVWGLAFKPKTDDMREAPSIIVIQQLQRAGANIRAFDPVAKENAEKILTDVVYSLNPYDSLKDVDALVIVTEWNEFRNLDKLRMKEQMKKPIIVDGRNIYDPDEMESLGFKYIGVGRRIWE